MTRRSVIAAALLALLLAVPAYLLHRLLYTPEGLAWLLSSLQRIDSVRIDVTGAQGTLAGPLEFRRLVVDHAAVRIEAEGVRGSPVLAGLLAGRIDIADASIDRVEVTLKDRGPQPDEPVHFLPAWLRIAADGATVTQAGVRLKDGTRLHVASVRADLRMTRWRLDVAPFTVEDAAGRLDGEVFLRATAPLGLRGKAAGRWTLPDGHLYRFTAAAKGKLDRLGVDLSMTEPARLAFSGYALDLEHEPRVVGTLRAIDFDGAPWLATGSVPAVSGSVAVDASARGIGADGTLTSPAAGPNAIRVQGSARYSQDTLDVVSLRAWQPRSGATLTISGSVQFAEPAARLALTADWKALQWPLTGDPVVTSPSGTCRLSGTMPYDFELNSQVNALGLPAADFAAHGTIGDSELVVMRLEGNVLRGRLSGSGRLAFDEAQAWQATVDGRQLDISTVRKDLTGRLDVTGELEGRGLAADSPWKARLSKLSGTLNGRALTGRGEISYGGGTYELKDVRIANGRSYVDVDGRYGPTVDLRWSADLASLAVLDPGLAGELTGSGTLRGRGERPEVKATLSARMLRAGGIEAGSARLEMDVDLADRRDSLVVARAGDVTVGSLEFHSVQLQAAGRVNEHGISLVLESPGSEEGTVPGFEANISAEGSADVSTRSWDGTLTQASFDFPDDDAHLAQPVSLRIGPALASATPLCLVSGGARLCAEGEWHASPSSWRVLYSAENWPLRRLLTSLLGRREFDGTLQLSGWAEQQPGRDWVGGTAVLIDRPTVEIRRNRFRSDRMEIGAGRIDVYADEDVIRATATLSLAAETKLEGAASARRERGRPLGQSPLSGEMRAESSVLTALPLVVPEIDRSEGRLEAAVRLGGTLADPRFDGDFHLRDGRLDLYRTNLTLTKANIDGRFAGDTLSFDGQATTAKGPVTLSGRFAWPDGAMTGSMRLTGENMLVANTPEYHVQASPDLTVTADDGSYLVTGRVVIPSAKISPKDLSSSRSTSPDERIVGERAATEPPAVPRRVRTSVDVVLGDDVRVDTYGLKARLGGQVRVSSGPGEEPHGTGEIRVLDGEYKAFGVYVKIVRGVLTYRDAPLASPTIDLVAEREIKDEDITVSVNARGPIDKPLVTITSKPVMPSNEALSYLLTGRSLNTLQSNEAASVNRAAESLAVGGGGFLLGSLGSRIGLDEVSVESTRDNDTQVVLGKFLSPKLFVSYGVSIAEAINTIKLRYTINSRWALKAEAGLEQSADVEFKIER